MIEKKQETTYLETAPLNDNPTVIIELPIESADKLFKIHDFNQCDVWYDNKAWLRGYNRILEAINQFKRDIDAEYEKIEKNIN